MSLARLEGLARAVTAINGGEAEKWREMVRLIRLVLPVALPFFTPATALELETLFAHEIGEGPTDPDPGF